MQTEMETGAAPASGRAGATVLPWLAAGSGGAIYFLAYLGFGLWPLAGVFLVPLWWSLERLQGAGRVALAGGVFGLVAHFGGHLWLWRLVDVFLGGDARLGAALFALHGLWFAAAFAVYALLFRAVRRRGGSLLVAGVPPLLVVEWLQLQLFPVHAGSCLAGVPPLVQIADLGGPLLLSAFVASIDVVVYRTLAWGLGGGPRPWVAWASAAVLVAAVLVYGTLRVRGLETAWQDAELLRVGIVQANLDVLEKRERTTAGHELHVALTRELLEDGALDLVVWPETAELRGIRGPLPVSGRFVREGLPVPLLFGGTLVGDVDGRRAKQNAALLVEEDGMVRQAYRKNLLIPLAESVPFGDALPGLAARLPHAQDFAAATDQPALVLGGFRMAVPICYEAVRPDFVRRMVAAGDANLLVTLANDAWFGDSQEPWMHLQLARLRAIEQRRYLVRATNSGISALVDPTGRIVARTGLLSRETLRGSVRALDGRTVYARLGDWPGVLAAAILAVALLRPARWLSRAGSGGRRPDRESGV